MEENIGIADTDWQSIAIIQRCREWSVLIYTDAPITLTWHLIAKSNHQHLGTIQSSDPSGSFVQYNSPSEMSVCNSASLILLRFFTRDGKYDFPTLSQVTKHLVLDLDTTLDQKHYPTHECRNSNLRHRPIGISVEGLADVFITANLAYDSPEAAILNRRIFEVIYHAAVEASCELARAHGTYDTWTGSPAEKGRLQFNLWRPTLQRRMSWSNLKTQIQEHGLRNSVLVATAPNIAASGFSDCNISVTPYRR